MVWATSLRFSSMSGGRSDDVDGGLRVGEERGTSRLKSAPTVRVTERSGAGEVRGFDAESVGADGEIGEAETAVAAGGGGAGDVGGALGGGDLRVEDDCAGGVGDAAAERGVVDGLLGRCQRGDGQGEEKDCEVVLEGVH